MFSKFEKKKKGRVWKKRCWKLTSRHLTQYTKECTEQSDCVNGRIKIVLDLSLTSSLLLSNTPCTFPNELTLSHPATGELQLRFASDSQETMKSWLKILSSFCIVPMAVPSNSNSNGKYVNYKYTAIPSNYSYAIYTVLQTLYEHESILSTKSLFRIESAASKIKARVCEDLLFERISAAQFATQHCTQIHLLANSLKYLLGNLPGSLFGDKVFSDLVAFVHSNDILACNDSDPSKTVLLKGKMSTIYAQRIFKFGNRIGLLSLLFHLLKHISLNSAQNGMTCTALARLLFVLFESRSQTMDTVDSSEHMKCVAFVQCCIYHAYHLFPRKKWAMSDIVVAERQEIKTIEKYRQLQMLVGKKKNSTIFIKKKEAPTKYFEAKQVFRDPFPNPNIEDGLDDGDDEDDDGLGDLISETMKRRQKSDKTKGNGNNKRRFQSRDDLNIGALKKEESNFTISMTDDSQIARKHKSYHFEQETMHEHSRKRSNSLGKPTVNISSHSERQIAWKFQKQSRVSAFCNPGYDLDAQTGKECIYFVGDWECSVYNLADRTLKRVFKYNDDIQLHSHCLGMDFAQRRMFVFGGNCVLFEVFEFDWKKSNLFCRGMQDSNKQQMHCINSTGDDACSIYIANGVNEFHIIGGESNRYHLRWNEETHKMRALSKFPFAGVVGHSLLFLNDRNALFLLGGYVRAKNSKKSSYCDDILYCELCAGESTKKTEWRTLVDSNSKRVCLPLEMAFFGCVLFENAFIMIFGGKTKKNGWTNDIYYLSLHTLEWNKSNMKCPKKSKNHKYKAIIAKNGDIHLFEVGSNKHHYINVKEIIPAKDIGKARKLIKEKEIKNDKYNVPTKSDKSPNAKYMVPQNVLSPSGSAGSAASSSVFTPTPDHFPIELKSLNAARYSQPPVHETLDEVLRASTPSYHDNEKRKMSKYKQFMADTGDGDGDDDDDSDDGGRPTLRGNDGGMVGGKGGERNENTPTPTYDSATYGTYLLPNHNSNGNGTQTDEYKSESTTDEVDLEIAKKQKKLQKQREKMQKRKMSEKSKKKGKKNKRKLKNKIEQKQQEGYTNDGRTLSNQEIKDESFSCRVMFGWFSTNCGVSKCVPPQNVVNTERRMPMTPPSTSSPVAL